MKEGFPKIPKPANDNKKLPFGNEDDLGTFAGENYVIEDTTLLQQRTGFAQSVPIFIKDNPALFEHNEFRKNFLKSIAQDVIDGKPCPNLDQNSIEAHIYWLLKDIFEEYKMPEDIEQVPDSAITMKRIQTNYDAIKALLYKIQPNSSNVVEFPLGK